MKQERRVQQSNIVSLVAGGFRLLRKNPPLNNIVALLGVASFAGGIAFPLGAYYGAATMESNAIDGQKEAFKEIESKSNRITDLCNAINQTEVTIIGALEDPVILQTGNDHSIEIPIGETKYKSGVLDAFAKLQLRCL